MKSSWQESLQLFVLEISEMMWPFQTNYTVAINESNCCTACCLLFELITMLVYMCTYIDHYDNMMAMGLCLTDWRSRLFFRTCAMFAEALWEPTKTLTNHSILPGEEKKLGTTKRRASPVVGVIAGPGCPIHSKLLKLALTPTLSGSNLLGMCYINMQNCL